MLSVYRSRCTDLCTRILQQHLICCRSGRGEALLSFRRAPRGLALRRYRVRFHHATAVAQSYRGDFGSPASTAGDSSGDALAVHSARIPQGHVTVVHVSSRMRDSAPLCVQGPSPSPAHPTAHSHAVGMQVASTAGSRQRPCVAA